MSEKAIRDAIMQEAREVVDDELNCFMNDAPPGYWSKRVSETVEALRGQLDRALQARAEHRRTDREKLTARVLHPLRVH